MTRRFIVAADKLTAEQEKVFRDFLSEKGTWWHWIANFWLFATTETDISVSDIRNKIAKINPDSRVIAMEIPEDIDWSTRGVKNAKGKNMTDWLKSSWLKGE